MPSLLAFALLGAQDQTVPPKTVAYHEVKVGSGREARIGDRVTVHLHVRLAEGKTIVDSLKRRQPYTFVLKRDADQSWKTAVEGMKVDGVRRMRLPPEQGWGRTGNPPVVPKDATLVVTVTLRAVAPSE